MSNDSNISPKQNLSAKNYFNTVIETYEYKRETHFSIERRQVENRGRSVTRSSLSRDKSEVRSKTLRASDVYSPGFQLFVIKLLAGWIPEYDSQNVPIKFNKDSEFEDCYVIEPGCNDYLYAINGVYAQKTNAGLKLTFGYQFNEDLDKKDPKYQNAIEQSIIANKLRVDKNRKRFVALMTLEIEDGIDELNKLLTRIHINVQKYLTYYLGFMQHQPQITTQAFTRWERNPFLNGISLLVACYKSAKLAIPLKLKNTLMSGYNCNLPSILTLINDKIVTKHISDRYDTDGCILSVKERDGASITTLRYLNSLNTFEELPLSARMTGYINDRVGQKVSNLRRSVSRMNLEDYDFE